MSVFSKRLKEARLRADISQEKLGVLAGIDEMSASARMNQYERQTHAPKWVTVDRLASALNVPVAYFYADDDLMAALLLVFHQLPSDKQEQVLSVANERLAEG